MPGDCASTGTTSGAGAPDPGPVRPEPAAGGSGLSRQRGPRSHRRAAPRGHLPAADPRTQFARADRLLHPASPGAVAADRRADPAGLHEPWRDGPLPSRRASLQPGQPAHHGHRLPGYPHHDRCLQQQDRRSAVGAGGARDHPGLLCSRRVEPPARFGAERRGPRGLDPLHLGGSDQGQGTFGPPLSEVHSAGGVELLAAPGVLQPTRASARASRRR